MEIEEFDPHTADEATALAYCDLLAVSRVRTHPDGFPPPPAYLLNQLRVSRDVSRRRIWLARSGGAVAGAVEASWEEAEDNRDRAYLDHDLRSFDAGLVDALLVPAAAALVAEGRTNVVVNAAPDGPIESLLAARGGTRGSVEQHNVTALDRPDRADLAALAGAVPAGYELLSIDGPCPDDLLEPYTVLASTMNTAPRDDLTEEDAVYTPARVRDWEETAARRGWDMWTVVAREVATGELAAYTQLVLAPEWPEVVQQEDTAVTIPHRGHGLGLWLKAVNLLRVLDERPGVRRVETWNAASNDHMLRVNRRLGFVLEHTWHTWEIPLASYARTSEAQPA
ncbi:MAG: hypothetical protein QOE45_2689 [Frankiaceae bacterium]|nr:hypothetical protein [Frankiaceae bacterium]